MCLMVELSFNASRGHELATYKEICTVYTDYVRKKYGEAIFVFDGNEGTSTKDMTHQRRAKGQASVTVTFTTDMQFTMKKDN